MTFSNISPGQQCGIIFQDGRDIEAFDTRIDIKTLIVVIVFISLLYLPVLYLLFIFRHKQAVHFKSPLLIIICGCCLYFDSLFVVMSQSELFAKQDYRGVCAMSVSSTIVFHYTAYFCIIFRAIRIF